jgi:hypothetical protein
LSAMGIFQQLTDTRPTQPLQMEKRASNLVSAPLVLLLLLHLQPLPLFRGNRFRGHAEQEESFASVKDDEVVAMCAVCIEERPGTIRIDRVASVRREIGPVSDVTVGASGRANEAAPPISAVEGDANLGDGAAHDIVHARPAEGIGPFEAGNATAAIMGMNVDDGSWNMRKSRKDRETRREKKVLSELAHF